MVSESPNMCWNRRFPVPDSLGSRLEGGYMNKDSFPDGARHDRCTEDFLTE